MHTPRGNRRGSHDDALGGRLEHEPRYGCVLGADEALGHDEHRGRYGPQSQSTQDLSYGRPHVSPSFADNFQERYRPPDVML